MFLQQIKSETELVSNVKRINVTEMLAAVTTFMSTFNFPVLYLQTLFQFLVTGDTTTYVGVM